MMALHWFAAELGGLRRGRLMAGTSLVVAGVLLAIGLLAVTTESAFVTFATIAYVMLPLMMAPMAAAWMKAPRATGLTRAIFTSPSTQAVHFWVRVAVLVVLAFTYLLATLPILGVFVAFSGFQVVQGKFLALAALLAASSLAVGILLGVATPGRGLAAPVGGAVLFALASIIAVMSMDSLQQAGSSKTLLRAMHVLPAPLAWESLSLSIASAKVNADPWRSALALAGQTLGLLCAGAYLAIRAQGPESWRILGAGRLVVALLVAAVIASPVVAASVDYSGRGVPLNPGIEVFGGGNEYPVWLVKAHDGTPNVKTGPSNDAAHFALHRPTAVDFVYYLRIAPEDAVSVKGVAVQRNADVRVDVPANALAEAVQGRESFAFLGQATNYDGERISHGTILRVPATVTSLRTTDLGKVTASLNVTITFTDSHAGVPAETTHMTVFTYVDSASTWILGVGLLPVAVIGIDQAARWIRRRA